MTGSVLIVEDDADTREMLAELLKDEGYTVHTAQNGAVALDLLSRIDLPDVVLVDMMMPVMTGAQFLGALRNDAQLSCIQIILTSGWVPEPTQRIAAADRIEVVPKPVNVHHLLDAIARCCQAGRRPPASKKVGHTAA
jgi:CheY-like chemotaxis protein